MKLVVNGTDVDVSDGINVTQLLVERKVKMPGEQFKVVKTLRAAGQRMLAVHHSHPASPARPSAEDIRLALTPDVLYTILSLQDADSPVLKAFSVDDGVVKEHPLVIEAQ